MSQPQQQNSRRRPSVARGRRRPSVGGPERVKTPGRVGGIRIGPARERRVPAR
jgi:hypothetical protein